MSLDHRRQCEVFQLAMEKREMIEMLMDLKGKVVDCSAGVVEY